MGRLRLKHCRCRNGGRAGGEAGNNPDPHASHCIAVNPGEAYESSVRPKANWRSLKRSCISLSR